MAKLELDKMLKKKKYSRLKYFRMIKILNRHCMRDALKLLKFKAVTYDQNSFQQRDAKKKNISIIFSEQKLVLYCQRSTMCFNKTFGHSPFHFTVQRV